MTDRLQFSWASGELHRGREAGVMKIERINKFLRYCATASSTVGLVPTCQWVFGTAQLNLNIGAPRFLSVRPSFLKHPVKLRARTSDAFVFRQIMIENEYLPLRDLQVATILDLGANIGLSSAWFLCRFPEATVFAVEADVDNYATCCENLEPYGSRARTLHGAAWSRQTNLTLRRKSCAADNSVEETVAGEEGEMQVPAWSLANLIEMSGFVQVDLLKMDIEGAETTVFRANVSNWLGRVRNLCIELHGQACREAFFKALAGYDYEHVRSGELDVCTNLRPKVAA